MKFPEKFLIVEHIDEPQLEFAFGQSSPHPKDGLFLYGPLARKKKTQEVRIGVVGTPEGIAHFRTWGRKLKQVVPVPPPGRTEKRDRLHLADFPGLEETFGITFDPDECSELLIPLKDIDTATRIINLHEAVDRVSKLFIDRVQKYLRNEERAIDLWLMVLPEIVFERCRPASRRNSLPMVPGKFSKKQKAKASLPLLEDVGIIDQSEEDLFYDVPDFRRRIKAEFLSIAPTQLIRETTLNPDAFLNNTNHPIRKTQDRATVAWNLATGIYYKTQPTPPWRLASVRSGVCYIGMVYKALPQDPEGHSCCAAQMFLNEGDGVVFRGANGPWKTGDHEYHLKRDAAKNLLNRNCSAPFFQPFSAFFLDMVCPGVRMRRDKTA